MNRRGMKWILVVLAGGLLAAGCGRRADQGRAKDGEDESASIIGAMEFDHMREQDPHTGLIPSGAVMAAYRSLKARGFYAENVVPYKMQDETEGWQPVNDFFPSLSVTKITYDPNNTQVFYFCTGEGWYNADAVKGAGVWKSVDGGNTWAQLASTNNPDFDYCQDIAVHPATGDVYVATRSAGLQRSTDGGITWQKVLGAGAGASANSICDIDFTADGDVFTAIGIFATGGIYFSPSGDSGTYVKQVNGFPTGGIFRIKIATAPSDAGVAYAVTCNSSNYKIQGIYKTTDKGSTWFAINRPDNNYEFAAKQAWYDLSLAVDPHNADIVAMGGLNLWRSQDGGDSWQQISSGKLDSVLVRYVHVDQHEIVFQNSDTVYFTNDGGIWRCDNFSAPVPFIYNENTGYDVTQFYSVALHPFSGNNQVMGGTQDNGTPYCYNDGLSPFKEVSDGDGAFIAFHTDTPRIFYTAAEYRPVYRFTNGGYEVPDTIANHYLLSGNMLFINPFIIDYNSPDVLYQGSSKGLWRLKHASTADSTDWEKACNITGIITAIAVSVNVPNIVFFGRNTSSGEIYRVDDAPDADSTLAPVNLDPLGELPSFPLFGSIYCSSIAVDPNNAAHLIITYSNYGVNSIWETHNALDAVPEWQSVEGDFPDVPVYSAALHPLDTGVCYIATEIGVFYTDHLSGASTQWIPCTDFPVVRTDMVSIRRSDLQIVAGTHGRGIWQASLDPSGMNNDISWQERGPTNVGGRTRTLMIDPNDPSGKTVWAGSVAGGLWKTNDISAVPVTQELIVQPGCNVFPNPAPSNGFTVILTPATGGNWRVALYDVTGRYIDEIMPETHVSGNRTVTYMPRERLHPGLYFVVFVSGNTRIVKKLIIAG